MHKRNWSDKTKTGGNKVCKYKHAPALALNGSAIVRYDKGVKVEKADVSLA